MKNRDEFLSFDDETLSRSVVFEFYKGTGNGGQKRNKTSSAVRVRYEPLGICAEDCTERSQHRNRANALRKLRIAIAFSERELPAEPPAKSIQAVDKPDYPLYLAHLLDVLSEAGFDHKAAAEKLALSPSALLKRCYADPELWQYILRQREAAGLSRLLPPR